MFEMKKFDLADAYDPGFGNCERKSEMKEAIILASNSPRRSQLLNQIGVDFVTDAPKIDEALDEEDPVKMVKALSERKALAVAKRHEGKWVLGADTVVYYDGEILGKPSDPQEAYDMLCMLSGRRHEVITGVTLLGGGDGGTGKIQFAETTAVWMYPHYRDVIRRYIESGEPMDKAGAYGIQGLGAILVEKIDGDYNNVVGLPVGRLYMEMIKAGILPV